MLTDIVVQQTLICRSASGTRFLAKSPGFLDEWESEANRLVTGYGERPGGVACPGAVFAQPLGKNSVAIVQVADGPAGELGQPNELFFHLLVVPREPYVGLWGDPFALADRLPPSWHARGPLPEITWPAQSLPPRTVAQVQEVLKKTKAAALTEDEDIPADWDRTDLVDPKGALSPALLGGTQVLVDGGKVFFERPVPNPDLIRGLWMLLPLSTRCHLWPATFAFSNQLSFDAVVIPTGSRHDHEFPGYTNEDQACEYPQGYYELHLQIAAEAGNQRDLDALFARRSWRETWRLAIFLLIGFTVLAVVMNLNFFQAPMPDRPRPKPFPKKVRQASHAAGVVAVANPWTALALIKANDKLVQKAAKEKR